jgi:Ca-activated chloride channel family protein
MKRGAKGAPDGLGRNRMLRNEDFKDDTKDAGEIGSGHSVSALYEIVPAGGEVDAPSVDPLRYQRRPERTGAASSDELVTVKLRYKAPDGDASRLVSTVVRRRSQPMTANVGFASAVAEFGMLLRGSKQVGAGSFDSTIARARTFKGDDPEGSRAEFISLAELAKQLQRAATRHQDTPPLTLSGSGPDKARRRNGRRATLGPTSAHSAT